MPVAYLACPFIYVQKMADKTPTDKTEDDSAKQPHLHPTPEPTLKMKKPAVLKKVKFTVHTYPDLQPFLEMAVPLLEGVYEHMSDLSTVQEH